MTFVLGIALGAGAVVALLFALVLIYDRREKRGPRAASQQAVRSPIEEMVAAKALIREDEAARWVESWMRITGARDKWAVVHDMNELAHRARMRELDQRAEATRLEIAARYSKGGTV